MQSIIGQDARNGARPNSSADILYQSRCLLSINLLAQSDFNFEMTFSPEVMQCRATASAFGFFASLDITAKFCLTYLIYRCLSRRSRYKHTFNHNVA